MITGQAMIKQIYGIIGKSLVAISLSLLPV